MQPDVLPPRDGQAVAEPLVRELVRDQPLRPAPPVHVVGAEHGQPLRLERDLEVVVGDHDGVPAERVGAEPVLEQRQHLRLPRRGRAARAARSRGGTSTSPPDGRPARTGRSARWPGRAPSARAARTPSGPGPRAAVRETSAAVGDDLVARPRRVIGDAERRLVRGAVVAREPARCAVGLAGDDDAVLELLPARPRPTARAPARAARRSAPRRRAACPAGTSPPEPDGQIRPPRCVHRSGRRPSTSTWRHPQPVQLERDPVERAAARARARRARPASRLVATRYSSSSSYRATSMPPSGRPGRYGSSGGLRHAGATGLPVHREPAGIASPRSTSDAGPTRDAVVQAAPRAAPPRAGRGSPRVRAPPCPCSSPDHGTDASAARSRG